MNAGKRLFLLFVLSNALALVLDRCFCLSVLSDVLSLSLGGESLRRLRMDRRNDLFIDLLLPTLDLRVTFLASRLVVEWRIRVGLVLLSLVSAVVAELLLDFDDDTLRSSGERDLRFVLDDNLEDFTMDDVLDVPVVLSLRHFLPDGRDLRVVVSDSAEERLSDFRRATLWKRVETLLSPLRERGVVLDLSLLRVDFDFVRVFVAL